MDSSRDSKSAPAKIAPKPSWKDDEVIARNNILKKIWNQLSTDPKSRKGLKDYFLVILPPVFGGANEWRKVVDKAWADPDTFKKENEDKFYEFFKHLELSTLNVAGWGNGLVPLPEPKRAVDVTVENSEMLKKYLNERNIHAAAVLGSLQKDEKNLVSCCSDNYSTSDVFSTHSVTKIFTGILVISLIEQCIVEEKDIHSKIQFDESVIKQLRDHRNLQDRLETGKGVTLYDAMTHMSGLGVADGGPIGDYYSNYLEAIEKARESKSDTPKIVKVEDFLKYIPDEFSPKGKYRYSNSGIILASLGFQHLYNKHRIEHPEKKLEPLDFNGLIDKYVKVPATMACFSYSPKNLDVKYNKEDKNVPCFC